MFVVVWWRLAGVKSCSRSVPLNLCLIHFQLAGTLRSVAARDTQERGQKTYMYAHRARVSKLAVAQPEQKNISSYVDMDTNTQNKRRNRKKGFMWKHHHFILKEGGGLFWMTSCRVLMHAGVKFSSQHRFSIARMDLSNSLSTQGQKQKYYWKYSK